MGGTQSDVICRFFSENKTTNKYLAKLKPRENKK